METINSRRMLSLAFALVATLATSSMALAQCGGSCGSAGFGWSGGCADGHCGDASGSYFGNARSNYEQMRHDFDLVTARNDAWPLPFNCWDREAYYVVMNQQYAHGLQMAHTLTSDYFDPNTHELNRVGEMRVAWIMQNSPSAERQIYVYEDQTGPALDMRMASIRQVVDRWYGHLGPVNIASSRLNPTPIPATYQKTILDQYASGQPAPVIPIASGTKLTSSVN